MILVLGWGIVILGLLALAGYLASLAYDWYNETVTVTDPVTGEKTKKSTKKSKSGKKTDFRDFDSFDEKAQAVADAQAAAIDAATRAAGKAGASIVDSDIESTLLALSNATGANFMAGYVGSSSATGKHGGGKKGTTSTTGQGSGRSR